MSFKQKPLILKTCIWPRTESLLSNPFYYFTTSLSLQYLTESQTHEIRKDPKGFYVDENASRLSKLAKCYHEQQQQRRQQQRASVNPLPQKTTETPPPPPITEIAMHTKAKHKKHVNQKAPSAERTNQELFQRIYFNNVQYTSISILLLLFIWKIKLHRKIQIQLEKLKIQ